MPSELPPEMQPDVPPAIPPAALPPDEDLPEPPQVRRLRRLVTALTLSCIVAVLAVAAALVGRVLLFDQGGAPLSPAGAGAAAQRLALPAGERIVAVGQGPGTILLVTEDAAGLERLRRYDAASGALLGVTAIERR